MKKVFADYYLGLDVGTNSVGWAASDFDYNVLKFNGKQMWGVHLFGEGSTAEKRRMYRSGRRCNDRKKQRVELLQELFAEEISKKGPGFYLRLAESKFWADDKKEKQPNTLFNDNDFKDKDYHSLYPTVYHLRHALIDDSEKMHDIRLLYLAIAHILKHRGHFLLQGQEFNISSAFEEVYRLFSDTVYEEWGLNFECSDMEALQDTLKASSNRTTKKNELQELFGLQRADKIQMGYLSLLVGASAKLSVLMDDPELDNSELKKIDFSKSDFDEKKDEYQALLGDRYDCITSAKAVYDWALLSEILQGKNTISLAKIASYKKHKNDLAMLKAAIKKICTDEEYREMFKDDKQQANYIAYIGKSRAKENKSVCEKEDLYKTIKAVLKGREQDKGVAYIFEEIDKGTFLPKQATRDNGVIPYQLHYAELKAILENAERYHAFLKERDKQGLSVSEKILKIMTFRIPYYVGPINDAHKDMLHGHCWLVKKSDQAIRPWNFEEVIDLEASGENFIKRMTNKCTYYAGADVVPKDSLLYSRYMVLNELNNLRVNGTKIDVKTKQNIFENLCKSKVKVREKDIYNYLLSSGIIDNGDEISGIDGDLKASMKSYLDFRRIISGKDWDEELIEECIKAIVLFGDEKTAISSRVNSLCRGKISAEQIKKICNLRFSGWGRFSEEFLAQVFHIDESTGEAISIISALYNTNENLMQLLSGNWQFIKKIEEHNAEINGAITDFTYEAVVEPLYCSPAVKRGIWRALSIVREVEKITGHPPKKIFVEMAREEGEKVRTKSRKDSLVELYKSCGKECDEWCNAISGLTEGELRKDKLYLYYTQMGCCMYSGDRIELDELFNDNLYDIDHIYPQSKTKDDSLENRVLVKKTLNKMKSDMYPLPAEFKTDKTTALWSRLYKMGLIGKIKYSRLIRTEGFSEEELAGFINRQLVETRQSTKAIAQSLQTLYSADNTEVVFVKAGNVSSFRKENKFIKLREINDYHHAKDAYLNIVVGNVYNTKFTKNPAIFIKEPSYKYSLNKMFDFDVKRGGVVAWEKGETGSIATVKRTLLSNRILFTRYAFENSGEFYKQMPLKKGHGQIPLKSEDARFSNIDRYGGYNSDSSAYYMLVEHNKKGKRIRSIEYVPVRYAKRISLDKDLLMQYCLAGAPNGLGLSEPKILIPKIKIDTLFNIDGFPMHISGRTGDSITFKVAAQLCLEPDTEAYLKRVVNYVNKYKANTKNPSKISSFDKISAEENLLIYDALLAKHRNTVYSKRPSSQIATLEAGREVFKRLSLEEQCLALLNILTLFKCVFARADLKLIGGSGQAGTVSKNKNITDCSKAWIINQSVTGLFSNTIDLLSL